MRKAWTRKKKVDRGSQERRASRLERGRTTGSQSHVLSAARGLAGDVREEPPLRSSSRFGFAVAQFAKRSKR